MTVQFACVACGSPSIVPPVEFTETAPVRCKGCGRITGTWGELRRHTLRALRAEAADAGRPVSPDPLDSGACGAAPC